MRQSCDLLDAPPLGNGEAMESPVAGMQLRQNCGCGRAARNDVAAISYLAATVAGHERAKLKYECRANYVCARETVGRFGQRRTGRDGHLSRRSNTRHTAIEHHNDNDCDRTQCHGHQQHRPDGSSTRHAQLSVADASDSITAPPSSTPCSNIAAVIASISWRWSPTLPPASCSARWVRAVE